MIYLLKISTVVTETRTEINIKSSHTYPM